MGERSFMCGICRESHDGFPTDLGCTLPDDVWAIPEPQRHEKAHFDNDLCELGERFFIRCVLYVPFTQRVGHFGWGVWVEVAADDFFHYVAVYREDARGEPQVRGKLANGLKSYSAALGEAVTIRFGTSTQRPAVFTEPDSRSSLAREQRDGMDESRYHQVLLDAGIL